MNLKEFNSLIDLFFYQVKKENPNENYDTFMNPNEIAEFITFAISFDNNLISSEVRLGRIK